VFSYYLIKAGVLMNLGEFLKFCCKNNKSLLQFIETSVNYEKLHKVFIESAKKNKLLNKMTNANNTNNTNNINNTNNTNNTNKESSQNVLNDTMRMTLYELKI
jgi:hypothetical protein